MKALLTAGTAKITSCTPTRFGLAIAARGEYEQGIGSVGFVLIDLNEEPITDVVDHEDVEYDGSLPTRVSEEWTSRSLVGGARYCVFFNVYDRAGVNLVAYDRCDFTLPARKENVR